ncbi:hypothetical protein PR202_ga04100 [Eleusine coracana subsp. coracana]|uniref:EF-hand domain-containing protein n=1 Tax=Eleusine coracana subsp. coracana TaxID=191504 RepID=A0AAV5BQ23_ELECO|nr:hypothetical protein PR202_ga04100 [Eleusine coracana subsp. coracana]
MPRHGCRHQARENFLLLSEDDDALKAMDFGLSVWDWEVFRDIAADKVPTTSRPRCSRVMLYTSSLLECRPFGRRTRTASSRQDFVVGPRILSKRCSTSINPKERLTAFHVLDHPWIKQDGDAPDTPLDNVVLNRLKQFRAMNQFKKATLIQEEITGLKKMFKNMDKDNSWTITLEELKNGLAKHGTKLSDGQINKQLMDANGRIDYSEFVALMRKGTAGPETTNPKKRHDLVL